MSDYQRNDKITLFVRNVLGCGCPDEVFNKIEISDIDLTPEISTATRIVVGDTLLIYILPDNPVEVVANNIGKLVAAGKKDRDSYGYNRFRLVVRSGGNRDMEEQVITLFAETVADNEKLHLHFVDPDILNKSGICSSCN